MATKSTTSTSKVTKTAKAKAEAKDPFASTVEAPKKSARVTPKAVTAAKEPVKKAVRKLKTPVKADPFAEVASAAATPKKRAATTTTVKAEPKKAARQSLDIEPEIAADEAEITVSPVFKALAHVKLPELQRENRARLQMQTPTRVYFYWTVRENPWSMVKKIFGDTLGNYTLVLKLKDLDLGREEIHQCDAEGNWWFNVEPDRSYQAEVGFYAVGRPYFRVLHSNTVKTPRRSPSPRSASEASWTISSNKFAEVLDVAGFSRDAFDVAMAGDDMGLAADASVLALRGFLGIHDLDLEGISSDEIRYALIALASGLTLTELKGKISPRLYEVLSTNLGERSPEQAMASLTENFEIEETEITEEVLGPAVFGASLVNFPKTLITRTVSAKDRRAEFAPRYNPVSSHSVGR